MTDFLTRVSRAALGLTPVVGVLGVSRYGPGPDLRVAEIPMTEEREGESQKRIEPVLPLATIPPFAVPRAWPAGAVQIAHAEAPASIDLAEHLSGDSDRGERNHRNDPSERSERIEKVVRLDVERSQDVERVERIEEPTEVFGRPGHRHEWPASEIAAAAPDRSELPARLTTEPAVDHPAVPVFISHPHRSTPEAIPEADPPSLPAPLFASAIKRADPQAMRPREPEHSTEPAAAPTIRVTIGRIDVRAVTPPSLPVEQPGPPAPRLSLDDYLRLHNGRTR